MALAYLFDPNMQFQDKGGKNNVNGFLRVYVDGTDDRAPTYRDFTGTFNTADIRLDNNGRAVVIVDDTMTYRLEMYDRDGAMLWTQYPVMPSKTVINYGINNTYVMNADVRGTPDEIDVSSTTDPQTGFKTFFIKLSSTVKNFFDFVSNTLTNHGESIGNLQTTVSNQGTAIGILQNGKKNKQDAKIYNGSATKTVKKVTQNADGEMTVEFEDIDLPPEVPNVEITSPNGTIVVQSSTDVQTNTKTFEIDVANGGNSIGWFNTSNIDTVGNEEYINVDRFRISEGQTVLGNGVDFVPTPGDIEGDVQYGHVYLDPGIYFINSRLNIMWSGTVNKVCNVSGLQFDFSYAHNEKRYTTNVLKVSSRSKVIIQLTLDTDIPSGLRLGVERLQIFAINAGTLEISGLDSVEHDDTLTGDGTGANPLSVVVDDELDEESENPVQNKVLYGIIGNVETLLEDL